MQIVYKYRDMYLRYSRATTHTGTRDTVTWVDNILHATIFPGHPLEARRKQGALAEALARGAIPVVVQETRTVDVIPQRDSKGEDIRPGHLLKVENMAYLVVEVDTPSGVALAIEEAAQEGIASHRAWPPKYLAALNTACCATVVGALPR